MYSALHRSLLQGDKGDSRDAQHMLSMERALLLSLNGMRQLELQ